MMMEDMIEKKGSSLELSDEQKDKLQEAMGVLKSLASECDCSVEELVEMGEKPEEEEEQEESSEMTEAPSEEEEEGGGKKVALMIAQLKAKKA